MKKSIFASMCILVAFGASAANVTTEISEFKMLRGDRVGSPMCQASVTVKGVLDSNNCVRKNSSEHKLLKEYSKSSFFKSEMRELKKFVDQKLKSTTYLKKERRDIYNSLKFKNLNLNLQLGVDLMQFRQGLSSHLVASLKLDLEGNDRFFTTTKNKIYSTPRPYRKDGWNNVSSDDMNAAYNELLVEAVEQFKVKFAARVDLFDKPKKIIENTQEQAIIDASRDMVDSKNFSEGAEFERSATAIRE